MRQRLLIGAVMAMTALSWYAVYRTVRFTIAVATELGRASNLTSLAARAQTTIVLDRHGRAGLCLLLGTANRRHHRPGLAAHGARGRGGRGSALPFALRPRPDSHRGRGSSQRSRRESRRGRQHHHAAARRAVRLSPARTFERKLREAMLALRLEERYSKAQILQEYLNTVYFGEGFYGVEAASRGYFGKPAAELAPGRGRTAGGSRPGPVARRAMCLGRARDATSQPGACGSWSSRVSLPPPSAAREFGRRCRTVPTRVSRC